MSDLDAYLYPGTDLLRNKLNIDDAEKLDHAERLHASSRALSGSPDGKFDLAHLQAIHQHLFQDVYEWAGKLRSVFMTKGDSVFMPPDRIEMGMGNVHQRLVEADFLRNTDPWEFSAKAAEIIGNINHAHPFREGNGRTQLEYLRQLGEQAGHVIDLTKINGPAWIQASIDANFGSCGAMNDQIRQAIVPILAKEESQQAEREQTASISLPEELRQALEARHEKERQALLDRQKAESARLLERHGPESRAQIAEKHAQEIREFELRHEADIARHREDYLEEQRLRAQREEQRIRDRERELDDRSRQRGR
jgi:cell filamentation protein